MRCPVCGNPMTLVEKWDQSGCCGVSVTIEPTCPRCVLPENVHFAQDRRSDLRAGQDRAPEPIVAGRAGQVGIFTATETSPSRYLAGDGR